MTDQPTQGERGESLFVRRFEVSVVAGADAGARRVSDSEQLSIGTAEGNDLRLTDPLVSRHHCTLRTHDRGLELRDHASRNGTFVGDCEVVRAFLRATSRVVIGRTTLEVRLLDQEIEQPLVAADRFGALLGGSSAMRRVYALIEACAPTTTTVLIGGETGTGKELVADAIHDRSPRSGAPFVVVDCSALSHELAESELFGHVRGAFTGADGDRAGAFENARGGTVFLDEIGELPEALQPLLLRVLEQRAVRRVGADDYRDVDVRIIAATHRDLRMAVNAKQFRADLYYRLAVFPIDVPPLRDRPGDIRALVEQFWQAFRTDRPCPAELANHCAAQSWPGNVRELRNTVERAALLGWSPPARGDGVPTYQQAKDRALFDWERTWVEQLLATHGGNLSRAARAVKMGRSHLREMARRHGVGAPRDPDDHE